MQLNITGSSGFVGTNFIKKAKEFSIAEIDLLTREVSTAKVFGESTTGTPV